jgi:predicted transcriptional regulator
LKGDAVTKKDREPAKLLTDVELELMQVLWDRGEAPVRDVMEALPKDRRLAYTTVATVLKVLEKKKFVSSHKGERTHVYSALVSREAYEKKSVHHLVDKVFRGEPSSFVMQLLSETKLTPDEIESFRQLLERIKT